MNIRFNKEDNEVRLSKTCTATGELFVLTVDYGDYASWDNGTFVQDAFPYMDKAHREFIKTGTTPAEWNEMFGICPLHEDEL
ncbi:hypothetical protein H8D29_03545 [PVC group bacterium]|nr:hypothetical protein [PVC group bacterium]